MKDAVQQIKDRLAKIADQDTRLVIEHRNAYLRMSKLGYTPEQLRLMLLGLTPDQAVVAILTPEKEQALTGPAVPTDGWWGFEDKRQAMMALQASAAKPKRAAAVGDAHERVLVLIKNQEPDKAAGLEQIIMMPAVLAIPVPAENVKVFRKLASGRLKALGTKEEEPEELGVIDVPVVAAK